MREIMTAAVLTGHGGPERLEVRDDVAVPRPGPGEVLVAVTAAGMNNTDIWTRQGAYGTPQDSTAVAGWRGVPLAFPRIQGGEVAGRVVDVGTGVSPARVGERVVVDPAEYDAPGSDANPVALLGSERDGGFAEFVAVDAARAHGVGASPLTDAQVACLPIAYATAFGMLERGGVTAGERVLVTGASGAVGLALVQLAAARGASVVAITSADKADAVSEAGAGEVVTRSGEPAADAERAGVGGPLDVVADVAGGELLTALVAVLGEGGRAVVAGAVAGPVVALDLRVLYLHQRRLIGSSMHTPAHFERLVALARAGAVSPRVAATYPLADVHHAQRRFAAKDYVGKLVIVPGDEPAAAGEPA